jgi:hypothetical protein
MTACEERDRLLKLKAEAFERWYERKADLERLTMVKERSSIGDAKKAEEQAHKKVRHLMNALLSHYGKHECNKD